MRLFAKYLKSTLCALAGLLLTVSASAAPRQQVLSSPDGRLKAQISNRGGLSFTLTYNNVELMKDCAVSMKLDGKSFNGKGRTVNKNVSPTPVSERLTPQNFTQERLESRYNELCLTYKEYEVVFRAYDDGFAYRFTAFQSTPVKVLSEQADYRFAGDWPVFVTYSSGYTPNDKKSLDKQYQHSFENTYEHLMLSALSPERLIYLPMMVRAEGGICICITEADLMDYPGMYLQLSDKKRLILSGRFPAYPQATAQGGRHNLESVVTAREKFIAKYDEPESATEFPWRVIAVAPNEQKMAENNLVYKVSLPPAQEYGFGWVRPGKAIWDWWCSRMLHGVSFKSGINTQTYKHFVDFASDSRIEYLVIGEGWSSGLQADLFQVANGLDLNSVVNYAAEKNVGLILWTGYWAFHQDMDRICEYFSQLGVAGFIVDLLNRDDQEMVSFMSEAAATAAKHHLLIGFRGCSKPAGLTRRWPNVVSFESVFGMEKAKVVTREEDMVTNDVIIPFVRSVAGPVDYNPGAMRNASAKNYYPIYEEPMSQGTRCHQLAAAVVYFSPLLTFCDSPSNYVENRESFHFLSAIPTVWDETRVLEGKVGEYIVLARRSGDIWYIAGLNGWNERDVRVDVTFQRGEYLIEVMEDGQNAEFLAKDFAHSFYNTKDVRDLPIRMAPGGGFVVRIIPAPKVGMEINLDI